MCSNAALNGRGHDWAGIVRDCGQYHTSVYTLAVQKRSGTLWAGRMWRENVTSTPWDSETIYSFKGLLNKLNLILPHESELQIYHEAWRGYSAVG